MIKYRPCPICKKSIWIIGSTKNGKKLASCGHSFSFNKTKFQKEFDKKYIKTFYGWEIAE